MTYDLIRTAYAWACTRLYHEFAWSYDGVSRLVSGGRWDQWRALALPRVTGDCVLELGCGTGVLLTQLAQAGFATWGVDASPAMVAITRRRLHRAHIHGRIIQGRGQTLPFTDEQFDSIVTTFPAPYILEAATLAECARVLRKPKRAHPNGAGRFAGGRLVIVGLWVELAGAGLRNLPAIFYGAPSPDFLTELTSRLSSHGFEGEIAAVDAGWARVGVADLQLMAKGELGMTNLAEVAGA